MRQLLDGPQPREIRREMIVAAAKRRLPSLMRPILGLRRTYLPLLIIYFAYGALGIICPSSDNLRLIRYFEKGGSGSSGVRV
ncbi:hypothetical protein ASC80_15165 [Afipia sp. Root123D2]|nr:hypothetical protein ASC80_15165 [Afipia sp. Root123D2]